MIKAVLSADLAMRRVPSPLSAPHRVMGHSARTPALLNYQVERNASALLGTEKSFSCHTASVFVGVCASIFIPKSF